MRVEVVSGHLYLSQEQCLLRGCRLDRVPLRLSLQSQVASLFEFGLKAANLRSFRILTRYLGMMEIVQ